MSGKKPRRVRWHPTPDTFALAMYHAAKPARSDIQEILDGLAQAHKAMREGVATDMEWSILSGALDIALFIERQGAVRGLIEHLASTEPVLQAIYDRANQPGGWVAPVLHFYELDIINAFVALHSFQIKSLSRAELVKAIRSATGLINSQGGKVTFARNIEEVAA